MTWFAMRSGCGGCSVRSPSNSLASKVFGGHPSVSETASAFLSQGGCDVSKEFDVGAMASGGIGAPG